MIKTLVVFLVDELRQGLCYQVVRNLMVPGGQELFLRKTLSLSFVAGTNLLGEPFRVRSHNLYI